MSGATSLHDFDWDDTSPTTTPSLDPKRSNHQTVQVTDLIENESLGYLGNLTPEGFVLIADTPLVPGSLMQVSFSLRDEQGQARRFDAGVCCLLSEPFEGSQYLIAFEIIDISEPQLRRLRKLYSLL